MGVCLADKLCVFITCYHSALHLVETNKCRIAIHPHGYLSLLI